VQDDEYPRWPSADPRWAEVTKPLREYLSKRARTWTNLENWAEQNGVTGAAMNNQLAWLENERLAWSYYYRPPGIDKDPSKIQGNHAYLIRWKAIPLPEDDSDQDSQTSTV